MQQSISFTASVIQGEGKGKKLGTPTLNLNVNDVPKALEEGVYVVQAIIDDLTYKATMHYGPRPTLGFKTSCEIHLIDSSIDDVYKVSVKVFKKMREIQDFGSTDNLQKQIAEDIAKTKIILSGE